MMLARWAPTSYIVFVLVHLYLRLSENVLPCEFYQHACIGDSYALLDTFLLFMIVVHKVRISSVMWSTLSWSSFSDWLLLLCLVTSSSHCCVYAACRSYIRYNIHFAFILLKLRSNNHESRFIVLGLTDLGASAAPQNAIVRVRPSSFGARRM